MKRVQSLISLAVVALLVVAMIPASQVRAASFTSRSLTLGSSQPGFVSQNINHTFSFNASTTASVGSLEFLYCLTPIGSCTGPTGLDFTTNGFNLGSTSADQSIATVLPTNLYTINATGQTANRIRINATTANSVTATNTLAFRFGLIENPTVSTFGDTAPANSQPDNVFFVRINTYTSTTFTTPVDDGVVASAIEPLITVSARVQEILNFCVANTSVDDSATTSPGADCSAITGTTGSTIDLGVADNSTTSAVSPSAGGNSKNGIFMVRTNAVNGTVVGYRAVQQTGTNYLGSLRVIGANCGGAANTVGAASSSTDQCFNSNVAKTALSASVEQFGMTGKWINRMSSATPTSNLALAANYDSTSTVGYAWVQTGAFTTIADSTASSDKVIDDEAVILKFAAVAALTTPTGVYQAQGDFIAVPTY